MKNKPSILPNNGTNRKSKVMERIMQLSIYPVWITLLLAACSRNPSSDTVAIETGLVKGIAAAQETKTEKGPPAVVFPKEETFPMKILTTGTFHEDEIWEGVEKEAWVGLFKGKDGYYLAPTTIGARKIFDPLVDEDETEKTGWEVTSTNPDSTVLLMEANLSIQEGNVQALALSKDVLYPGDSLQFSYGGADYVLFATGEQGIEKRSVKNYKLYLSATHTQQSQPQLLVAQPSFDDHMIRLLFIGDLDGDNKPDLIIDRSPHYNMQKPTLYLSGAAGPDEMTTPVAAHRFVGC